MTKFLSLFACILVAVVSASGQKKEKIVIINTRFGNMVAILYNETPKHKANFIKLAGEHFYDSRLFHRVISGFMIQGGDPDSKKANDNQSIGSGGPGYTIEAEFDPKLFHKKGVLAAARLGDALNPTKASSGSQFYIVQGAVLTNEAANELRFDQAKLNQALQQYLAKPEHQAMRDSMTALYSSGDTYHFKKKVFALAPTLEKETGIFVTKNIPEERINVYSTLGGTPHLDGGYTVFGELIAGIDVLDKIASVKTGANDRPLEDVRMFVSVKEMSKKKIEKMYGYHFPIIKK